MERFTPKSLFIFGGVLVFLGFLVPLLMVLEIIPMVLWLEMIIAVIQMIGLVCGIIGSVIYVKTKRNDKNKY